MLEACSGDGPQQIRDFAILSLLLGCGLRRAEIPALQMSQVFLYAGYIRLVGKGNKERTVYLNSVVKKNLTNWINYRGDVNCPHFVRQVLTNRGSNLMNCRFPKLFWGAVV